ncbi:MAG: hypothetical protein WCV62_06400 [Candidatus Peribacteraceae bacterium]|jgi:hypothetical protein
MSQSFTIADSDLLFEKGLADVLKGDERHMFDQLEYKALTMQESELRRWADYARQNIDRLTRSFAEEKEQIITEEKEQIDTEETKRKIAVATEQHIYVVRMTYYQTLEELFEGELFRRTKVPEDEAGWM